MNKIMLITVASLILCEVCVSQGTSSRSPLDHEIWCLRMEESRIIRPLEEALRKARAAGDDEKTKQLADEINRILVKVKMQNDEDYWAEVLKKQAKRGREWVQPPRRADGKPTQGYWRETRSLTTAQEKAVQEDRKEKPRWPERQPNNPLAIQRQKMDSRMSDLEYWNCLAKERAEHGFRWAERPDHPDGEDASGHWESAR